MINEGIENENLLRAEKYRKNEDEESFLIRLNNNLARTEHLYFQPVQEQLPNIFIIGAPRSGTTLLSQLITFVLDIGYINNFIARFWEAPLQGIRLSNIINTNLRQISFNSTHGVTSNLNGPHEFGYYWTASFRNDKRRENYSGRGSQAFESPDHPQREA